MMVKVELKPHMGVAMVRGREVARALPQQRVFVEGDFVGYVSDTPGRPFCATVPEKDLLPEEIEAINQAIAKHHGGIKPPEMVSVPTEDDDADSVVVAAADDEYLDPTDDV